VPELTLGRNVRLSCWYAAEVVESWRLFWISCCIGSFLSMSFAQLWHDAAAKDMQSIAIRVMHIPKRLMPTHGYSYFSAWSAWLQVPLLVVAKLQLPDCLFRGGTLDVRLQIRFARITLHFTCPPSPRTTLEHAQELLGTAQSNKQQPR
jgi:hypothetical protein